MEAVLTFLQAPADRPSAVHRSERARNQVPRYDHGPREPCGVVARTVRGRRFRSMSRRARYAVSGTDVAYGAMLPRNARATASHGAYDSHRATACPVLTSRMVLQMTSTGQTRTW
eukprot:1076059-Rhodomonas_salina.1